MGLGPLLFLVAYVNDIPRHMKCSIKMFADDTKIWKVIFQESDNRDLQEDLVHLQLDVKPINLYDIIIKGPQSGELAIAISETESAKCSESGLKYKTPLYIFACNKRMHLQICTILPSFCHT